MVRSCRIAKASVIEQAYAKQLYMIINGLIKLSVPFRLIAGRKTKKIKSDMEPLVSK